MKLTKLIILVSWLACLTDYSLAQGGREFWFAAPEVSLIHGNTPALLRVSTFDKPAKVTITQPANSSFLPITVLVPANSLQTINLTGRIDLIETKPADAVLNTGLFIKADNDISAYYEVLGFKNYLKYNTIDATSFSELDANNSDIFVLKGNSALGNLFFIPMQTYWPNQKKINAWSSFDIVATEDNTHITITPTQNLYNHPKGIPFSITLNKGQTYSARSNSLIAQLRPTGSKVTSDKPIAVTYKDDSVFDGSDNGHWDLAGDQLVPVENIGTDYIAIKASGRSQTDRVFICATENNTQVYIKNDTINLRMDSTLDYHLVDSVIYFKSSAPVYAFHISGFSYELGGAILPPITCTGAKNVAFVRSNHEQFALSILAKTGSEGNFTLNGAVNSIPIDSFRTVPGTNETWKYAHLVFPDYDYNPDNNLEPEKTFTLKNATADFHLATLNGGSKTGFRYGYFSGYGSVNLLPQSSICQGDSFAIDAGLNKDSYLWNTGETTSSISVKDTGTYWVQVKKSTCTFSDTTHIYFFAPVTAQILGNDTSSCANVPFIIIPKNIFASYIWQDNSTAATYTPTRTGNYFLQVTNTSGCRKSDTIYFKSKPIPAPEIVHHTSTEQFCDDSLVKLSVSSTFHSYLWYNGETTQSIVTKRTEKNEYSVSVIDTSNCSNNASLIVDCSPFMSIPNIFTPNGDHINDLFHIKNLDIRQWKLEVYSRWSNLIFHANPYLNDWQAEGLPDGLYFYLLKNNSTGAQLKGWVQIAH